MTNTNLIEITSSGIKVATFTEVREYFTSKMKEIYGNDIDLSTASADGQWLYHVAYIIHSLLQLNQHAYNMLDPAHANGKYLDIIASYNNIKRLESTPSMTTLSITNTSGSCNSIPTNTKFLDRYGNEWEIIDTNQNFIFEINDTKIIDVRCTKTGPIIAKSGDIQQANPPLNGFSIEQEYDAILGTERESDSELRYRRSHGGNKYDITVVDALKLALEDLVGVYEVSIIDNKTNDIKSYNDNISIAPHSIGIRIRLNNKSISNLDEQIFNTIYNKLTPGIDCKISKTDDDPVRYGEIKSYLIDIAQAVNNTNNQLSYNITFNWKECSEYNNFKFNVELKILDKSKFNMNANNDLAFTDQEKSIETALIKYFNSISINDLPDTNQILLKVMGAQLSLSGYTYHVSSANIADDSVEKFNAYTYGYFNITKDNIKFSVDNSSDNLSKMNITIMSMPNSGE